MADLPLTITADECAYLTQLLEMALKEARVEEHRTRTPTYREHVLHDEKLIDGLLSKLGKPAG